MSEKKKARTQEEPVPDDRQFPFSPFFLEDWEEVQEAKPCPECGSTDTVFTGTDDLQARFECNKCGNAFYPITHEEEPPQPPKRAQSTEEKHRMAAYHLNKARGNVIERKDYKKALEHAEKAIAFLKKLYILEEKVNG